MRTSGLEDTISLEQLRQLRQAVLDEERKLLDARATLDRFADQRRRAALEMERNGLSRQSDGLRNDQLEKQRSLEKITNATERAQTWHSHLAENVKQSVAARLNRHRIESFRLFQSMIPTPQLFDDISIAQGPDGVRLGLKFRGIVGSSGEPRYYLSNAQANVLALSYFLSFAWRQQWFKLRTILMDDPVQHLDDLDAVALLDVIRALVVSRGETRRQMIISTCDYNLYGLMIRKFSSIQSEGIRFSALSLHDSGADGPILRYDQRGSPSAAAA